MPSPATRRTSRPIPGRSPSLPPTAEDPTVPAVHAAVDVGANSAHLLVAAVDGHLVTPLVDESALLGLGDTVDADGLIAGSAREILVSTLTGYAAVAREREAARIAFVGTEPLRRAADATAVVLAVGRATGVPLHVLDHREEALLTLVGATAGRALERTILVLDIGGGSSQVVVVAPGSAPRSAGLRVGGARLTRAVVAHDPPTGPEIAALRRAARAAVAAMPRERPADVIAVGGTASNLAKVVPDASTDRVMTPGRLEEAFATLASEPAEAIAARFGVRPVRARILAGGAALLEAMMERFDVARVEVSEASVREGVVLALAHSGAGWRDQLPALAHGWGRRG